jgi:excisionase family DNA binding protein
VRTDWQQVAYHLRELADLVEAMPASALERLPLAQTNDSSRQPARRLLDYTRLAAYLGISIRSAKQLAAEGEIRKTMIGSRVLFDRIDADAYVERVKRSLR